MDPSDRARCILTYLADNEVAGTPRMIKYQLEIHRDTTISVDTVRRRLQDFEAVGYVDYLPEYGRGYYIISTAGRQRAQYEISDEELRDIIGARNR